ncbi:MAG: DUF2892 domain-containing protein [Chitinivibrionales bacterium]|nr:DUF2892 domain-containing protein [Chitinivibrionales bacterium]
MKKNMGVADRVIRLLLAIAAGVLIGLQVITGVWAIVAGVLALIFLATSAVGFCPMYEPFGIKTCKVVDPVEVAQTQMFDAEGDAPNKPANEL